MITGVIERYPRYARDQLRILKNCAENCERQNLIETVEYYFQHDLRSAVDFRDALEYLKAKCPQPQKPDLTLPQKYLLVTAGNRDISVYGGARYE